MKINCSSEFKKVGKIANRLVAANGKASDLLRDATLQIGRASDPEYGVPASAVNSPIYVGDHAVLGSVIGNSAEIEALYKKNPLAVNMKPRFNIRTGKYDVVCSKSGIQNFVGDSGELISMQTISPWNASYFPELFKQPLLYSHARDLVKRLGGTNPWGEVQNLQLAAYSGWGLIGESGTVAANMKQNVNVRSGIMSAPIINIKVFFNFTVEEMERAKGDNGSPFAGSLMAEKQRYAQYVIDMITDYLTYYGNEDTNTIGLLDVNGLTSWAGKTLNEILADTADTNKGYTMYQALAKAITDFMGASKNKFDVVRVAMSPEAYNVLTSTPYSNNYEPKSPLKIFEENFEAGVTKNGSKPKVEFFADPFLSANNGFDNSGSDKLVITAPEIGAGTDDEKQDLLLLGIPLENFTYPVYPNSYDQQHAVLRRFAGVFAPVGQAVKCYSGFGVKA
nr:MAG TPA: major capsid protein [Caudoviricetes sp.]